jgi:hypothetical protein
LTQTSRPFADTQTNASVFFIFSHRTFLIQFLADPHCTHLQATQADKNAKPKEPIFPTLLLTLHREIFILHISRLCSAIVSSTEPCGGQVF